MDFDEFCCLIHSRLVIKTSDGDYECVLKFVSMSTLRVTFEHVYELPTRDYLGTMHILFSSILSWKVLESVEENFDISNFDSSEKIISFEFAKNERIDLSEIIDIAPDKHFVEYLPVHLKDNCPGDFCIVDSMNIFYNVLKDLSESVSIGVSFHGPKISRNGILTWLCMSTSTCVFLFDIERLGKLAFKEGLKNILESEKIEKVIHDCREASDCVLHLFNTELKCVFDTQAADYLINMQMCTEKKIFKYVNSLDSCLFKYLQVPQQFLYNRNRSVSFEDEVKFYQERPVGRDFINVLIKSSIYLLFLKKEQEKFLMSPYNQAVDLYLNSIRSASDSEVYLVLGKESYIAPDCLFESVKSIRFCDIPQPKSDFTKQVKDALRNHKTMPAVEKEKYFKKILQKKR